MISSNLASFPVLLENITWIRNFSLADGQLVGQSRVSQSGFGKLRDGPLENLSGGGGGRSTKKKFAQGKI